MRYIYFSLSCFFIFLLSACSNYMIISEPPALDSGISDQSVNQSAAYDDRDYAMRIPQYVNNKGERAIIVYPSVHAWGAYDEEGNLVRAGIATAGDNWCEDIKRPCRTAVGSFRIVSLGGADCYSTIYPLPKGGGLMPYCMYFHGGQALHGSPDNAVVEDNISHGCVRLKIPDAEWIRYNFAKYGTKVIVRPY
jgi:lipoprotein-anchoring transpeptidase ErfK/SrfK